MERIKIGRFEYELREGDKFLLNGVSAQLMTQSKEKSDWGRTPMPCLPKRRVKEIYELPNFKKYPSKIYENCFIVEITK